MHYFLYIRIVCKECFVCSTENNFTWMLLFYVCTKKISLNIYILQHLLLFSLYWWKWFQWNILFYLVHLVLWLFTTYDNNPARTVLTVFFLINIAIMSYNYYGNVQRIKKSLWKSLLSCCINLYKCECYLFSRKNFILSLFLQKSLHYADLLLKFVSSMWFNIFVLIVRHFRLLPRQI